MPSKTIRYSERRDLPPESMVALYHANRWSSAEKPELLHKALLASHSLATAWDGTKLVGLGNAISDGYLGVYYHTCLSFQSINTRALLVPLPSSRDPSEAAFFERSPEEKDFVFAIVDVQDNWHYTKVMLPHGANS